MNKKEHHFREPSARMNWQIKVPSVRVIKDNQQLGVMSTDQARKLAEEAGLDLIEVVPTAKPPVCQIVEYGRYKYELRIKEKELAKKQRESQVSIKELRLRPGIADHDIETKLNQAKKFLTEGSKVQFNLEFKGGRELSHKDQGYLIINKIIDNLKEIGIVDKTPKMEGKRIICSFAPKPKI